MKSFPSFITGIIGLIFYLIFYIDSSQFCPSHQQGYDQCPFLKTSSLSAPSVGEPVSGNKL